MHRKDDVKYIKILMNGEELEEFLKKIEEEETPAPSIILSVPEFTEDQYMDLMSRGTDRIYHGITKDEIVEIRKKLKKRNTRNK